MRPLSYEKIVGNYFFPEIPATVTTFSLAEIYEVKLQHDA
jgi:hypothetical protein